MSLYAIDQRVWIKPLDSLGVITEANYVRRAGGRKAQYIVDLVNESGQRHPPLAYMTGSDELRAADWCCDGCGRWLPGHAYKTAPDGEYPNGMSFCFLCVEVN